MGWVQLSSLVRPKIHGTACVIGPKGEARIHGPHASSVPKAKLGYNIVISCCTFLGHIMGNCLKVKDEPSHSTVFLCSLYNSYLTLFPLWRNVAFRGLKFQSLSPSIGRLLPWYKFYLCWDLIFGTDPPIHWSSLKVVKSRLILIPRSNSRV